MGATIIRHRPLMAGIFVGSGYKTRGGGGLLET